MPIETQQAVDHALTKTYTDIFGNVKLVTKNDHARLVDAVCDYFTANNIDYGTFSYDDLLPYL